jgi:signal transduction histidine kinase
MKNRDDCLYNLGNEMERGKTMSAATLTETKSHISHAINNRLNTIILGMSILETNPNPESQMIVRSLKMELRDLQALIEQLKQSA